MRILVRLLQTNRRIRVVFVFRNVLMTAGEAQTTIASELAVCESEIDEQVLGPLNKILEVGVQWSSQWEIFFKNCFYLFSILFEFPNIYKIVSFIKKA